MTPEQVVEAATEVWQTSHWTSEQIKRLERFTALVRNATLEEAAREFENETTQSGEDISAALRNLKDKT